MRRLPLLLLASCAGAAANAPPPRAAPACRVATDAHALAIGGHLLRAVERLSDPVRCPAPPEELASLQAELAEPGDPDALIAEGLASNVLATRQRLFDRAMVTAARTGRDVHIVPRLRSAATLPQWSTDGRRFLIATQHPPSALVVDLATQHTVLLDGRAEPHLSADGTLVVLGDGMDFWVVSAETGETVVPRITSTLFWTYWAPDGRLLWTDRDDHEHRLHRLAIGGAETVLTAPTSGPRGDHEPELDGVAFTGPDTVVAWTAADRPTTTNATGEIFVWRGSLLVARVPAVVNPTPVVDGTRLVFTLAGTSDEHELAFLDLAAAHPTTVHMPRTASCGDGDMAKYGGPTRCAPGIYVGYHAGRACVWDLTAPRLTRAITLLPDDGDQLSCSGDTIYNGPEGPPGVTGTMYSVRTGANLGTYTSGDELQGDFPVATGAHGLQIIHDTEGDGLAVYAGDDQVRPLSGTADAQAASLSPDEALVAVTLGDGSLGVWSTQTGAAVWRSATPPEAERAVFAPGGDLVIAGEHGALWRIDLARRRLTLSPGFDGCSLADLSAGPHGALFVCKGLGDPRLYREGVAQPLLEPGFTWALAGESIAYHDTQTQLVHVLPRLDRAREWTVPAAAYSVHGLALSPAGEQLAIYNGGTALVLQDRSHVVWQATVTGGGALVLGRHDRVISGRQCVYLDVWADGAAPVDTITSYTCAAAFDPTARYVAYAGDRTVLVRDLETRASRTLTPPETPVTRWSSIHWSHDGALVAATADRQVVLWNPASTMPPALAYVFAGGAAIADGSAVTILGAAAETRAHLGCLLGARLYPYAVCQDRVEGGAGSVTTYGSATAPHNITRASPTRNSDPATTTGRP